MGGIGKTQLCADFARRHQEDFSAIFWLDGSSRDALRQGLAAAYIRLPMHSASVFQPSSSASIDVQEAIEQFLQWLSQPDNTKWLLIFDNVDRDWQANPEDEQAYDIESFLPSGDHGNVLITTRLSRMQRPRASLRLDRVDRDVAREMIETYAGKQLEGECYCCKCCKFSTKFCA